MLRFSSGFSGRRLLVCSLFLAFAESAQACTFCNAETTRALYDSRLLPNLVLMCGAFVVLAAVVVLLATLTNRRHKANVAKYPNRQLLTPVPLLSASMVLGMGMGGFLDGIVLHQVLQWHEMVSARIPPTSLVAKSVNMFWDGVFHAFCLVTVFTGTVLLWRLGGRMDINRSGRLLAGGLLLGWGVFNLVEGIINHHLLSLHNVKELSPDPESWNYGFLAVSVLLVATGTALARTRQG